ncbi:hypothetical protein DFH08DRAFT_1041238 [Mycena albidolilacea]|uniref:Transmembrane protein n=1 Tax=Mycena albidolilacea TaxID=1033008 RepID=A0AAD6ZAV6_9AGAR|nr:hypothetical protein DFH08DRAFT_1041238 [Mycena albidolilacea]
MAVQRMADSAKLCAVIVTPLNVPIPGSFRMGVLKDFRSAARFCRSGLKVRSELAGTRRLILGSRIRFDEGERLREQDSSILTFSVSLYPASVLNLCPQKEMLFNQAEMETGILGAWDLGACSCLFLEGVLCAQFAHYLSLNKRDSIRMKIFVAGLVHLTTLKSLQSLAMMWIQNVTLFGDQEAVSNIWHNHWVWNTSLTLEAITAFYVQMFFCCRLWAISRNAYLVITCITLFLFGLVSGVVVTFCLFTSTLELTAHWTGIHLGVVLCGDLLLTGSTICYLLVRIQFLISLCFGQIDSTRVNATTWMPALTMVNFIPNMLLPQLYAWSAMWTLNSREEICLAAEGCSYTINLLRTSVGGSSNSETTFYKHQDSPVVKVQAGRLDSPPESMA